MDTVRQGLEYQWCEQIKIDILRLIWRQTVILDIINGLQIVGQEGTALIRASQPFYF